MRSPRVHKIFALFCAVSVIFSSSARAAALNEYQIKAAFLFQFTKFVEWPAAHVPKEKFCLCVTGKDPFGPVLDELQNEKIKNLSADIKRVKPSAVDTCQLLFISESESKNLPQILNAVKGKSILTVSDIPDFLDRGGMIRFLMQGNKIRFEISDKDARAAGLKVSSKLLSVSSRVVS